MGVKSSLTAPTAVHQSSAAKAGVNATGLVLALQEQIGEVIYLLKETIKTLPTVSLTANGTISTASATIAMSSTIPSSVVAGMSVTDVTNGFALGTVASGAGTTTLTLQANALHAGSGSNDVLKIDDANLAGYTAQLAALA
jgi:hypothetical protein